MNYDQLKHRIQTYNPKIFRGEKLLAITMPENLTQQEVVDFNAFLFVATNCFLREITGEEIPDDLTDELMEMKSL